MKKHLLLTCLVILGFSFGCKTTSNEVDESDIKGFHSTVDLGWNHTDTYIWAVPRKFKNGKLNVCLYFNQGITPQERSLDGETILTQHHATKIWFERHIPLDAFVTHLEQMGQSLGDKVRNAADRGQRTIEYRRANGYKAVFKTVGVTQQYAVMAASMMRDLQARKKGLSSIETLSKDAFTLSILFMDRVLAKQAVSGNPCKAPKNVRYEGFSSTPEFVDLKVKLGQRLQNHFRATGLKGGWTPGGQAWKQSFGN